MPESKVALLTAAGSGMGAAAARRLAFTAGTGRADSRPADAALLS